MPPGGVKPHKKRVVSVQPNSRVTRSTKGVPPSEIPVTPASIPHVVQADENVANFDQNTDPLNEGHGLEEHNTEGTVNQQGTENANVEEDVPNGGDGASQPHVASDRDGGGQFENDEPQMDDDCEEDLVPWVRGNNKGAGLVRISRSRRGKLPVVIDEGNIRPVQPIVASKYASECNIIVRNFVPVFPKWNDYKKQPAIHNMFRGKLAAKFDIDIKDASVKLACYEMLKKAVRQHRYHLKRKYFTPYPLNLVRKTSPLKSTTDIQWCQLVEYWAAQKNMENAELNKTNRSKVKYHQTTGSRSYMVHLENLGDKYKEQEADAMDMFKECHYSKNKGYTPDVQNAIAQMENKLSQHAEDEETQSVTEVVADVLAENTKKTTFLQNVGIKCKNNAQGTLKVQLAAERLEKAELQAQLDALSKKLEENEKAMAAD